MLNYLTVLVVLKVSKNRHFPKGLVYQMHATIPKDIVGGFEITFLHRNFERMAREAMDYVSEC